MANDFYNDSGAPSNRSSGSSSTIRAEFASIEAGFDKLPSLSGAGSRVVTVNSGATALEATALETVQAPTFVNSWVEDVAAGDATCGYYKDKQGLVHLQGAIEGGNEAGSVAFVLPAAYRPPSGTLNFYVTSAILVQVYANGNVFIFGTGASTFTPLNGIYFRT